MGGLVSQGHGVALARVVAPEARVGVLDEHTVPAGLLRGLGDVAIECRPGNEPAVALALEPPDDLEGPAKPRRRLPSTYFAATNFIAVPFMQ
jgi:hypothetical protein